MTLFHHTVYLRAGGTIIHTVYAWFRCNIQISVSPITTPKYVLHLDDLTYKLFSNSYAYYFVTKTVLLDMNKQSSNSCVLTELYNWPKSVWTYSINLVFIVISEIWSLKPVVICINISIVHNTYTRIHFTNLIFRLRTDLY